MNKDHATSHRIHFYDDSEKAKIDRYIEITCAYLNLFVDDDSKILDVGASDGQMQKHLRGKYSGIDIDPAHASVSRMSLYEVECEHDVVIFNHVLEHMPNSDAVMQHAALITRKGGYIFVNVPIGDWAWTLESHIVLFNDVILRRLLERHGLTVIETSEHEFRPNAHELWIMAKKS